MTVGDEDNPVTCSNPIDAAVLADYWLGALTTSQEEAVEEHLLACDLCGERLREVIALAGGIQNVASQGNLLMVVSDAFLRRVAEDGLRVSAEPYDERKAMENIVKGGENTIKAHLEHLKSHNETVFYNQAIDYLREKMIAVPRTSGSPAHPVNACPRVQGN